MPDVNGKITEFERLRNLMESLGVGEMTEPEWATYRLMLKEPVYQEMALDKFGPARSDREWWQVR